MHFSSSDIASSVRKATRADELPPKRKHIRTLILSTHIYSQTTNPPKTLPPLLLKYLTEIPSTFTAPIQHFQTLANGASPFGNTIHNASSAVSISTTYHGVQIFKALIVVHSLLQEGPEDVVSSVGDGLGGWLAGLVREVEWSVGGERGYGKAVGVYARYLISRIQVPDESRTAFNFCQKSIHAPKDSKEFDEMLISLTQMQTAFASALKASKTIVSDSKKSSVPTCRRAALDLLVCDCTSIELVQRSMIKNLHLNGLGMEISKDQQEILLSLEKYHDGQEGSLSLLLTSR